MRIKPATLLRDLTDRLEPVYDYDEANALARLLLRECLFIDRAKLMINDDTDIEEPRHLLLMQAVERLLRHEPVQHILGSAHFYGRDFKVSPAVLIPRPETEELVDRIISEHRHKKLRMLDIGTGSGCIPISLKCEVPEWNVSGLDVSDKALAIARENAERHQVDCLFERMDILSELPEGQYDVVISNPPYITESEKALMNKNVLDYEPDLALFVPDHDPLLFYRRITEVCRQILRPEGFLYFEINERYGQQTAALLSDAGFVSVQVVKDLNGKDRIVCGQKP